MQNLVLYQKSLMEGIQFTYFTKITDVDSCCLCPSAGTDLGSSTVLGQFMTRGGSLGLRLELLG